MTNQKKQRTMKKMLLIMAAMIFLAGIVAAQTTKWEVPAKYKTMKSTVSLTDASVIANGKDLWAKQCKSCHGAMGAGDGPKAAMLKAPIVNFASKEFQAQTDGEIYYKTMFGKDEMPAFDKKVTVASDQWALVAYMRTMKK
jgi:mono/diheme cytochrome c family protein